MMEITMLIGFIGMGIGTLGILYIMWMDYSLYRARKKYLLRQEKNAPTEDKDG
jgi:hypothetical protein